MNLNYSILGTPCWTGREADSSQEIDEQSFGSTELWHKHSICHLTVCCLRMATLFLFFDLDGVHLEGFVLNSTQIQLGSLKPVLPENQMMDGCLQIHTSTFFRQVCFAGN